MKTTGWFVCPQIYSHPVLLTSVFFNLLSYWAVPDVFRIVPKISNLYIIMDSFLPAYVLFMYGNIGSSIPLETNWSSLCPYFYSRHTLLIFFIIIIFCFCFFFTEYSFAFVLRNTKYIRGVPYPLPLFKGIVPVPSLLICHTCKGNTPTLSRLSTKTYQLLLIIPFLLPEPHNLFCIYYLLFFFNHT